MNFGDPSAIGTEMADRFVASGANLPPLLKIGLKGCKITKKIKSFPTEFFKNQPEVPKSRMAVKGLN